jgi:hypothetical protein
MATVSGEIVCLACPFGLWWSSSLYQLKENAMATLMKSAAIAMVGIACLAWSAPGQSGAQGGPRFEVRLAEDKPGKDLTEATVEGSTRKVFLHKEVILAAKDIAGAKAITIDDKPAIDVSFTPAGAKTLKDLTTANAGKRLAILVDGKVLTAPIIRDGITGGKAHITGVFTKAETERIAKVLTGK